MENARLEERLANEISFLRSDSLAKNDIIELLLKSNVGCKNCNNGLQNNCKKRIHRKDDDNEEHVMRQISNDMTYAEEEGWKDSYIREFNSINSLEIVRNVDERENCTFDNINDSRTHNNDNETLQLITSRSDYQSRTRNIQNQMKDDMKRYMISYFLQHSDLIDIRVKSTHDSELVVDLHETDTENDNDSGTYNDDYATTISHTCNDIGQVNYCFVI